MFNTAKSKLQRALTRRTVIGSGILLAALGIIGLLNRPVPLLSDSETDALFAAPLPPPSGPLNVFHLGHSLVGRDMPAMLQQLSPSGHKFASQLGWGTPLRAHWDPDETIQGFETENAHPNYRDAKLALASGEYDGFVLTEMVEIRAAIDHFGSAEYLATWARAARNGNPKIRIYLYETWHPLDDPEGWLPRLDADLERYWEREILRRALAMDPKQQVIYVIPAGQVMAAFVREVDRLGGLPGIATRQDLFQRSESGEIDPIHLNDLGNYLVALTHFAVLYQQSPMGLTSELTRADGADMTTIDRKTAALMQSIVWQTVKAYQKTGIP